MVESIFLQARKKFTLLAIMVALICAFMGSLLVFIIAEYQLNRSVTASELSRLSANNPDVLAYLSDQEPYHAHFETLGTLVTSDRSTAIINSLPFLLFGVLIVSSLSGWMLAKRFLEPIKESYISQRRFMQDAAHELRTPLAAMKSVAQQAQSNAPLTVGQQKILLDKINRQSTHLTAITNDLLLLDRKELPQRKDVDLAPLLQDVLEELHHQSVKQKIKIETSIPDSLEASIDPQHFVYIAKNLIENAVKFSDQSKKPVKVSMKRIGKSWRLTVQDYGVGIPKKDIASITQRFYRASNSDKVEGTGLGMAIVAKFVALYKGDLAITSEQNKGTTIQVTV